MHPIWPSSFAFPAVMLTFSCVVPAFWSKLGLRFLYASLFDSQKILAKHFAAIRLKSRNSWAPCPSQEHRWPRPSAWSACCTVHNAAPLRLISFAFASQPCLSSVAPVFLHVLAFKSPPGPAAVSPVSSWCHDDVTMALFHKYLHGPTAAWQLLFIKTCKPQDNDFCSRVAEPSNYKFPKAQRGIVRGRWNK